MNNIKSKILCMVSLLLMFGSAAFAMDPGPPFGCYSAEDYLPYYSAMVDRAISDFRSRPRVYVSQEWPKSFTPLSERFIFGYVSCHIHICPYGFEKNRDAHVFILNLLPRGSEKERLAAFCALYKNHTKGKSGMAALKALSDRLRADDAESLPLLITQIRALDNENILDPARLADDILDLSKVVGKAFFHPKVEKLVDRLGRFVTNLLRDCPTVLTVKAGI